MKRVIDSWVRWKDRLVGIEAVHYQDALRQTINTKGNFPLVPMHTHNQSKGFRLRGVSPLIESGMVFFPKAYDPKDYRYDPERKDVVRQLLEFPLGRMDDFVDALVWALKLLQDTVIIPILANEDDGIPDEDEEEDEGDINIWSA